MTQVIIPGDNFHGLHSDMIAWKPFAEFRERQRPGFQKLI